MYSLILMAENIQVNGNMAGRMARVNLIIQMATYMKVSLKMGNWKAREIIPLKMGINMKGHGQMIK